jgi:hypothetical protein
MRRALPVLIIGLACCVPSVAAAQTPDEDFVAGSASTKLSSFDCCLVDIDAHSGPSGENPTGTAFIHERAFLLGGPVTCLAAIGQRAVIGGAFGVNGYFFVVQDNAGTGMPDTIAASETLVSTPPTTCPASPVVGVARPVTSGDLVVHDARPFPTSKDQCKNGGWQTFGVFKNQGDCVSFVATGGKNPPSGP